MDYYYIAGYLVGRIFGLVVKTYLKIKTVKTTFDTARSEVENNFAGTKNLVSKVEKLAEQHKIEPKNVTDNLFDCLPFID
jgi:uncharacterized membrane-anchored protein YhcB (DUF1043 family)